MTKRHERPAARQSIPASRDIPVDPSMPYCVLFLAKYVIFYRSAFMRDRRPAYRSAKRSRSCPPWRLCREKHAFRFSCQRRAAILRQLSRSMTTRGEWRVCWRDASRGEKTFLRKLTLLTTNNEYESHASPVAYVYVLHPFPSFLVKCERIERADAPRDAYRT